MKPHRIELKEFHESWDGQWVEIKPWMSFASSARLEVVKTSTPVIGDMETFAGIGDGAEMKIDVTINAAEYAATMIDLQVLRWHVVGHDGEPLPDGRMGVLSDVAPIDVIDVIVEEMDKFYTGLRPNFKSARSA